MDQIVFLNMLLIEIYNHYVHENHFDLMNNEYFLYNDIVINTWRPTKEYEFNGMGGTDDFKYTSDNIFFLTITKKEVFEEMIEPMLKNIN